MSEEREFLKRFADSKWNYDDWCFLKAVAKELLAQPEQEPLSPIEKHETFLRSLIENNGEGLKELKAFDIQTYNKLKEVFGNES